MSPIGGVGVNLAVQDAVAAANILWSRCDAAVSATPILRVQARREFPAKVTQAIQCSCRTSHCRALAASESSSAAPVRLMARWPLLRRIPARCRPWRAPKHCERRQPSYVVRHVIVL